ncbi:MAG: class I SAM-dependent methyltransferase [Roseinatronobacter sp.]
MWHGICAGISRPGDLPCLLRQHAAAPFDAIVLSQVFEHVEEPLALLRALHQRLRKDGVLFVAVPNAGHVDRPGNFHEFTLVQPIEHINAFSPATLRLIGTKAGFTPLRRPSAFVTTRAKDLLRSAANWLWQPQTTDMFFRAMTRDT